MDCDNLTNYLKVADFDCVGIVAQHCDLSKLCIAAEEAKQFDLIPLMCFGLVEDVLSNWNLEDTAENFKKYQDLICGGTYSDCNGKTMLNPGFKKVWVYYTYSRYILINNFNDTANGIVQKQNEWSVPTSLKELNDFSNKYRSMAKHAYEGLLGYLCINKTDFPLFDDCGCKLDCGCTGNCSCGKTKKLTGFKFKTVRKNEF